MTTTTRRTITAAFALTFALGVSACDTDSTEGDGVQAETSSTPAGGATDDASDDGAPTTEAGVGTADAEQTTAAGDDSTSAATGDLAGVLAAIKAAEAEVGGTAYEVDKHGADGTSGERSCTRATACWEIDVQDGDRSVEVRVAADGTIQKTEEHHAMDADDRVALEGAKITISEAITAAIDEVGGKLDDAELDEKNGTYAWEISVDATDEGRDDVEVRIDLVSGEVQSVN